ncbi:hypothetical protein DPMN_096847 [Dreissena polymorpha]|uniref:BED-type domain-containing protein n=1 Tax=Dreissena polymorpha TaxID=45954 RepID=A0A9D4R5T7_DREPO|nr:hypothetical protein DPMN_096847 [Dreissena polymorpha]
MPPSRVWNYFTRSSDKSKATCNLCKQEFVYKSTTSNLQNHLDGQHPSAGKRVSFIIIFLTD